MRQIVGNGLIWAPSVSFSWADGTIPVLRTQLPLLFEVISTQDQAPILLGLTFGYAQVLSSMPVGSFSIAGTLQTQFSLGKL